MLKLHTKLPISNPELHNCCFDDVLFAESARELHTALALSQMVCAVLDFVLNIIAIWLCQQVGTIKNFPI
jgi:hypothetical protein